MPRPPRVLRGLVFGLALLGCVYLGAVVRTSSDAGESLRDAAADVEKAIKRSLSDGSCSSVCEPVFLVCVPLRVF